MERKRLYNELAWWKQEILVALAVVIYLAFGFVAIHAWSALSHYADAFGATAMSLAK